MNKLFDLDNPVMRFLSRLFDLMVLNVLFIVCSIPIITIGASLSALYSVALKMVKNEETYVSKEFFKSFRLNLKQGTILWLITVVIGIVLYVDTRIVTQANIEGFSFLRVAILAVSIICISTFTYLYPLQARFVNPVRQTIKNALMMCIAHLPYTVIFLAIDAVVYFIATRSVYSLATTIFVGCIGGIAGLAFIQSVFFRKIFKRYEPDEAENSDAAASVDTAKRDSITAADLDASQGVVDSKTFDQEENK